MDAASKPLNAKRLLSDLLPIQTVSADELNNLVHKQSFVTAPYATEDGIIYFRHGAYKFFQISEAITICIFAPNPDDLYVTDEVVTQRIAETFTKDGIALDVGSVLPGRPGRPEGDLLLLNTWLVRDSDKDAMEIMRAHQAQWQKWIQEHGTLKRLSAFSAASKSIIYEFVTHTKTQSAHLGQYFQSMAWAGALVPFGGYPGGIPPYKIIPQRDGPDTDRLGDLIVTPAHINDWDFSGGTKVFKRFWGQAMRLASLRVKNITAREAFEIARTDFPQRSRTYMWDTDHFEPTLKGRAPGKSDLRSPFMRNMVASVLRNHRMNHLHPNVNMSFAVAAWGIRRKIWRRPVRELSAISYGASKMERNDWIKLFVGIAAANAVLIGLDALKGSFDFFVLGGRVTGQVTGNTSSQVVKYAKEQEKFQNSRDVHAFTEFMTIKRGRGNQPLGSRLNWTGRHLYMAGLDFAALGIKEDIKVFKDRPVGEKAVLKYAMDSIFGRPNGGLRNFFLGQYEALRVDGLRTGFAAEHIMARDLCFCALNPAGRHDLLPSYVRKAFEDHPEHPYLMVQYDKVDKELKGVWLNEAQYKAVWTKLAKVNLEPAPRNTKLVDLPQYIHEPTFWDNVKSLGLGEKALEGIGGKSDDILTKPLEGLRFRL